MERSDPGGPARTSPAEIEALYMQHKDRLLTLATALTGHLSAGEDIVHDVFAMLVKDARRLRNDDNVAGFLSVCVRNRALDWRRMRDRLNKLSTAYAACRKDDPRKDPANRAAQEEEAQALLKAVHELPDELREIVSLKFWGGLSLQEIAELRQTTKSTAHARYCEAIEKLEVTVAGGSQHV